MQVNVAGSSYEWREPWCKPTTGTSLDAWANHDVVVSEDGSRQYSVQGVPAFAVRGENGTAPGSVDSLTCEAWPRWKDVCRPDQVGADRA